MLIFWDAYQVTEFIDFAKMLPGILLSVEKNIGVIFENSILEKLTLTLKHFVSPWCIFEGTFELQKF